MSSTTTTTPASTVTANVTLRIDAGLRRPLPLNWLRIIGTEARRAEGCIMPNCIDKGLVEAVYGDEWHVQIRKLNDHDCVVTFDERLEHNPEYVFSANRGFSKLSI